ncbi:ankyrin domain protein [Histomonas meleagridis]|uniref:ankyrin domain protein n=1 Tax=Histomonas meleagridis TaxID=135588 RepID=UPI00355A42CA|nr:ankyrin domain protein [Histomonas meleagridis]KAH0796268.1 ankyrin domain protein [Histomonas meleagridis]
MNLVQKAMNFIQYDNAVELKSLVPTQLSPDTLTYSPTNHLHTFLMCAAAHGSIKCAETLLLNGANPSKKNFTGFTALHWAAYSGRCEIVELLLEKNANINARDQDGKTPLHVAASRGHIQFIKFIHKLGADLNAVTSDGWSAVHFAIIGNHIPVAKYLVENHVDFDGPDVNGKTINDYVEEYGRKWFYGIVPNQ